MNETNALPSAELVTENPWNPDAAVTEVPFVDLPAQHCRIGREIDEAFGQMMQCCDFILGDEVARFEEEFAAFCGADHCVGVANGTDALHLACRAAGIGEGDEVIIPAFTFVATAMGVSLAGAKPVLVDVHPETGLIDAGGIAAAITPRTKAIIAVHIFGQCADMGPILELAWEHGLVVIEDAAQAHGARHFEHCAGSLADMACFSFYPSKNLGACGDGGAITTSNPQFAHRLRALRNWGAITKHEHEYLGTNSRLDTLQAAILRIKLGHLETWNEQRRRAAADYMERLANRSDIQLPVVADGNEHVYHLFVIQCDDRTARMAGLRHAGIQTGIHYPSAIHQLSAYASLSDGPRTFPGAESIAARCLSLPMFAELTEQQIERVVAAL